MGSPPEKINLISCGSMIHVSDIKLIRTDTTLDLSQKAEKGMSWHMTYYIFFVIHLRITFFFCSRYGIWTKKNLLVCIYMHVYPCPCYGHIFYYFPSTWHVGEFALENLDVYENSKLWSVAHVLGFHYIHKLFILTCMG